MIKERYVSNTNALLMSELGFDEPCRAYYKPNDDDVIGYTLVAEHNPVATPAPTQQMAVDWIRENYDLFIKIEMGDGYTFYGTVKDFRNNLTYCVHDDFDENDYKDCMDKTISFCLGLILGEDESDEV